jgi:hypothetical protein
MSNVVACGLTASHIECGKKCGDDHAQSNVVHICKRHSPPSRSETCRSPAGYADGNGLYLVVDPTGAKRWMLRTVIQGNRRDIGFGSTVLVSLAESRDAAMSSRPVPPAVRGQECRSQPRRKRRGTDDLAVERTSDETSILIICPLPLEIGWR